MSKVNVLVGKIDSLILILKFSDACVGVMQKMFLHKNALSQQRSDFRPLGRKFLASAPSACGGVVKI